MKVKGKIKIKILCNKININETDFGKIPYYCV